jgi:hypothetical protein
MRFCKAIQRFPQDIRRAYAPATRAGHSFGDANIPTDEGGVDPRAVGTEPRMLDMFGAGRVDALTELPQC